MPKTLDARGLACPAPVLMAKDAIEKDHLDVVEVIVDNEAARENVARFLGSRQFSVSSWQDEEDYKIVGQRHGHQPEDRSELKGAPRRATDQKQKIMILLATDRLGLGDDELGKKLIISFMKTIKEMGDELWRLVLVNNGVRLTTEDSDVLPDLKEIQESGVLILVCGTCLDHFNLLDKKMVGETTNMLDIVTAMQLADKVINI